MPNIKISDLSNVTPSGYTPNDLLVIVNYNGNPTGVTRNTKISDITNYVLSGFTGTTYINITYDELYSKVVNDELEPNRWYRLTDYRSVNFLNGWRIANNNPTPYVTGFTPQEIYTGETEVLLLQSITTNSISPIGYSETYPQDIVQYEPYTNKIGVNLYLNNGSSLPDLSILSGFDLQWDGTNVYFDMPTGYPALFGHYFYLYAEFSEVSSLGPIQNAVGSLSYSGDVTGLPNAGYFGLVPETLTGIGYDLNLDININYETIVIGSINNYGNNYAVGNTLKIKGSDIGGVDGINDITLTVESISPIINNYYQDGTYEPLTPSVCECQYPYSNDDSDYDYPKSMSRIEVINNGTKVILLDLNYNDFANYNSNTLYVETIYEKGDSYGWITRRQDTQRNIDVPFDFRARTHRRFEIELFGNITSFDYISTVTGVSTTTFSSVAGIPSNSGATNASFRVKTISGSVTSVVINYPGKFFKVGDTITIPGTSVGGTSLQSVIIIVNSVNSDIGYYCIGDKIDNQISNGNYKDYKSLDNDGYEYYNIKWSDIGGPDNYYRGNNDNTIFKGTSYNNTIGYYFLNNTFGNNNNLNTFGNTNYSNTFGNDNYSNTFGNNNFSNTFGNNNFSNTFGDGCNNNIFGDSNFSNTFGDSNFSNTFGYTNYLNTFGYANSSNTFGDNNTSNTFGDACDGNFFWYNNDLNTFGNNNKSNTFGSNNNSNTFGDSNLSNTFGNNNTSNTFDNYNESNTFGNYNTSNTFGNSNELNTFGDENSSNTFKDGNNSNTFGNGNTSNTFGNNNELNTFGNGNTSNTFGNNNNLNTFGDYNDLNIFWGGNQLNTFGNNLKLNYFKSQVLSTNFLSATHVYGDYNCTIFKRSDGVLRLSYYDNLDTLIITDITN